MAKSEHLAILKKGVDEWNAWRAGPFKMPNLIGANLSKANLSKADLSGAKYRNADLRGAKTRRAIM